MIYKATHEYEGLTLQEISQKPKDKCNPGFKHLKCGLQKKKTRMNS